MLRFDEQIAIVTGAASGMGLSITKLLAEQGAFVCMLDIDRSVMDASSALNDKGYNTSGYICDVSDRHVVQSTCEAIYSKHGSISKLANVAGISANINFLSPDIQTVKDKIFAVNCDGIWNMCQSAIPYMLLNQGGSIVNFSSVTGPLVSDPGMSIYSATKAAVSGLSKALAVEFAEQNIRVNCVLPGYIWTPMLAKYNLSDPDAVKNKLSKGIPLGRLGAPEEVGYAVLFLLADESSYITGHDLIIDGGSTLVETKEILKKGSKKVD